MKIKTLRTIFLVAFFLAVLLGMLCVTGCPSTKRPEPPELRPLGPISLTGEIDSMLTYKVYVKGLVCPACAVGLKKFLLRLPFVKAIHVNYKTGLVLIYEIHPRIDPKGIKKYDKSRITKAVEDSGYEVDRFTK
jgi:copper chaperone CopZ